MLFIIKTLLIVVLVALFGHQFSLHYQMVFVDNYMSTAPIHLQVLVGIVWPVVVIILVSFFFMTIVTFKPKKGTIKQETIRYLPKDIKPDAEELVRLFGERIEEDPDIQNLVKLIGDRGFHIEFRFTVTPKEEIFKFVPKVDKDGKIIKGVFTKEDEASLRAFRIKL